MPSSIPAFFTFMVDIPSPRVSRECEARSAKGSRILRDRGLLPAVNGLPRCGRRRVSASQTARYGARELPRRSTREEDEEVGEREREEKNVPEIDALVVARLWTRSGTQE